MGRLVLAGALVLAAMGHAFAGPTRKVKVESEPEGATVYIDDVDNGKACEPTPCVIDAPIGTPLIILRKEGFEPEVQELEVPKGKKALQAKYKLKSAQGTVKVDSPKGATVRIEGEDKGRAPVEVPVPAGQPLHVIVVASNKTVFDDVFEVKTGEEYVVKPKTAAAAVEDTATVTEDPDPEGGGGGGGSGGGEGGSTGIRETNEPTESLGKKVQLGIAFDVGFRNFTWVGATTDNLRDLTKGSQAITGPAVELWPGRLLGLKPLRGLSLFARYEFSVVGQAVSGDLNGTVFSKWSSLEASVRERLQFASIAVEAGGGFVQDTFHFDTSDAMDFESMPEAAYSAIRIGGKVAFVAPSIEPYLAVENRIVMSGGEIEKRFVQADASAIRFSLGIAVKFGSFAGRVEGTTMTYAWKLDNQGMASKWNATGASDSLKLISLVFGYQL